MLRESTRMRGEGKHGGRERQRARQPTEIAPWGLRSVPASPRLT